MDIERQGVLEFRDKDVTVIGADVKVGEQAPEFSAFDVNWQWIDALQSTQGKVRILGSLLSVSTSVCDRETRRFNEEAAALGADIAVLMLSMDLPYTQKNWCAAAGIDKVITLSDAKEAQFGKKYGLLLKEPWILRRAIFVVDKKDKVVFAAYMPKLGNEPDYPAVLEAARKALA
jgi:thiol peroxidase